MACSLEENPVSENRSKADLDLSTVPEGNSESQFGRGNSTTELSFFLVTVHVKGVRS